MSDATRIDMSVHQATYIRLLEKALSNPALALALAGIESRFDADDATRRVFSADARHAELIGRAINTPTLTIAN